MLAITTSPDLLEEVEVEAEAIQTSPNASPAPIEPADDAYVDDGPTILKPSPFHGAPIGARPQLTTPLAPKPEASPSPLPPPSRRAAPPPSSATKLPPVPMPPPSSAKLPPVPTAPGSLSNLMPPSSPRVSDSAPTTSPPPVEARADDSARAAALVARAAEQRYVPPSAPPPSVRPAQETIPASRYSLAPYSLSDSIPAPAYSIPPPRKQNGMLFALVAAAGVGIAAFAGFFAVKGGKALGFGGKQTGTLIVTAAGPNNAPVKGVRVFTDGVVRCEESPCRLSDVVTGTHFVTVDAPGFTATAARAVSVENGTDATLNVELVPEAAAKTADAPKTEATTSLTDLAPEKAATSDTTAKSARSDAPKSTARSSEKKDAVAKDEKKEPKTGASAAGDATLNINSIPMANVVLDGRPMGSTPLIGVHVTPGSHSVVFIHPEKGRKSAGATVKAGGFATVAVRF